MGLKLFFIISLAVSFHRLSTALPMAALHDSAPATYSAHAANVLSTVQDFKHPRLLPSPYNVRRLPSELSTTQHVAVGAYDFFTKEELQNLAAHHTFLIKSGDLKLLLSKTNPVSWVEDGKIYRSLEEEDRKALHDYIHTHVIKTPQQKRVAEDVEWLMLSEPTWWGEDFIQKWSKNNEYKKLVALGNLFKFDKPNEQLSENYIIEELHPRLVEILAPGKEARATKLNLQRLVEIEDKDHQSIFAKRIVELEEFPFQTLEKGEELLKRLQGVINVKPKTLETAPRKIRSSSHILSP